LTVTPDTGLVDGDVVAVHGTEFIPGDTVSICQGIGTTCPGGSSQSAEVNAAGEFSANLTVQRFLTKSGSTRVDCAVPSAGCAMLFSWPGSTGGPDRATVPLTFAPQPSVPQISGTLTDPGGTPVPGVDVWAYTPSDAWVGSLRTVTDAQGAFEFAQVESGVEYRILFRPPAGSPLASAWWSGQPARQLANVIALSPAEFTEVHEQLDEAGAISGLVTDASGNPVSGVQVSVFVRGDTWVGSHTTSTAADGTYVIGDLRPVETGSGDEYRVLFAPPAGSGLASEWFDDAASRSLATDITVSAGQTVAGIDAQLEATGAISGSVTDTNGNPVSGVRVSAYGPGDRWVGSYAASTAADGTYVIGNVRPTDYRVLFAPPAGSGLASEWFDDAASRSLATVVTVPPGQTATGIDAQFPSVP